MLLDIILLLYSVNQDVPGKSYTLQLRMCCVSVVSLFNIVLVSVDPYKFGMTTTLCSVVVIDH